MADAIVVQDLGKRFHQYRADRPVSFKESVLKGFRGRKAEETFWALRHVGFRVASGRMVGVIGPNGAGKSTLLRLIGGVGRPDEGSVELNGRIGALLDLGVGFHPDLSGRDNIRIAGVIAGLTRREVAARIEEIVKFAELAEFLDWPLRAYSTGMQMRLAFAIAIQSSPEILLIDESLAVGDIAFQQKCLKRLAQFKAAGCTTLMVSHDTTLIRKLCDEVLWLRAGGLMACGDPEEVVEQYHADMSAETRRRTPADRRARRIPGGAELRLNENRFGSLELEIVGVRLLDGDGKPVEKLGSGDPLRVEVEYFAPRPVEAPIFSITICREDGLICYDTSTAAAGLTFPTVVGQGRVSLWLERLDLNEGQYYIDVGAYERGWSYAYDYHWQVYPIVVSSSGGEKGILRPPHRWESDGGLAVSARLSDLRTP